MRTTDNNCKKSVNSLIDKDEKYDIEDLKSIANKDLIHLQKDNPDLLIFPDTLGKYHDDIEKSNIFSLDNEQLTTNNIMGFIGRNETRLTICSRFAKDDNSDYFLHYMLQKVFAINLLNFDQTPDKENIWDFLLYLFPYYLKKAYAQGLYKAYRRENYNDANVKGTIDVKRHIRINIPFAGKIAYTTREHSYDNPVTQLIRHTIEHIKIHPLGSGVLNCDSDTRDIVSKICFVTQNHYNKNARQKVINTNLKPVSHPYFTEYKILQKICLRILRRDKITFGAEKDKIYGLLFDGAWLWEEYLNTILKTNFIHPENKTGKHRHNLFNNFQPIYPDFISKDKEKMRVGDAKYIPLDKQREYHENSEKATSIYYKTITYMYRFDSNYGFLIFPAISEINETYSIKDTEGKLKKIGLAIPQKSIDFNNFKTEMEKSEQKVIEALLENTYKN
jgi:5-methylcytosine-specific restriction endonuclease McrBC regulatory subunit McrC